MYCTIILISLSYIIRVLLLSYIIKLRVVILFHLSNLRLNQSVLISLKVHDNSTKTFNRKWYWVQPK